jgi:protein TonB
MSAMFTSNAGHFGRIPKIPAMNRKLAIVSSVVLFHIAALWALQSGLMRRVTELVVPAQILVEILAPQNSIPNVHPAHMETAQTAPKSVAKVHTPALSAHAPVAIAPLAVAQAPTPPVAATPSTTINAVSVVTPPSSPGTSSQPAPASVQNTAAAVPRVELPSSDADYLNNPKPPYPPLSKRMGEQGKVIVRALIGVDGTAHSAEIKLSSGFDRLDQAALATTLRWRYVPGKRAGVPEAMWFNVPFNFVLVE